MLVFAASVSVGNRRWEIGIRRWEKKKHLPNIFHLVLVEISVLDLKIKHD